MIDGLYPNMQFLNMFQTVWIYSDTHFDDEDCKLMDPNWISVEEQIARINSKVGRSDVFIHLGDVGNPEYMDRVRGHKILITGNHDVGAEKYKPYFHHVYTGPLMISNKVILSHEPLGTNWAFNIHGHVHSKSDAMERGALCVTSNTIDFFPVNLTEFIKRSGRLKEVKNAHEITVDFAKRCGITNRENQKFVDKFNVQEANALGRDA